MAKIIPFPNVQKQATQLVDEIIANRLPHKHPEVLKCLKIEMTQLVKKYYPGEEIALSLALPRDLSQEQFKLIEQSLEEMIAEHNRLTSKRSNQLFLDLCMSRMTICELRHELQKDR